MNSQNSDIQTLLKKVKQAEKGETLDLSSGEDLSIAIMNLISIEEHLFFSGGKTGKTKYYELLNEVRKTRVELLKKIIKDYGGEEWCISKHILASCMRIMEVGTKELKKGNKNEAYSLFKKAYDIYNLFWGINLKLIKTDKLKENDFSKKEAPVFKEEDPSLFGKVSSVINKILDCCRE